MIRYVIAVLFTVAMLSVTIPIVGDTAASSAETQVERELATVDEKANSLLYNEDIPASGVSGPTREVTLSFPQESLTSDSVSEVVLQRETDTPITRATYHIDGRAPGYYVIDAPIVANTTTPDEPVTIEGDSNVKLHLQLEKSTSGEKIIVINRMDS